MTSSLYFVPNGQMPALYETNDASFIRLYWRSDGQDIQVYMLVCSYTARDKTTYVRCFGIERP